MVVGKVRVEFATFVDPGIWYLPEFMRDEFFDEYARQIAITVEHDFYKEKMVANDED